MNTPTTDDNQVNKVISTNPSIGTPVKKNTAVQLSIGQKQQQTAVPNVVGQSVKDAKKTLQQAGFNNIQFANGSDQSDNAFVVQQDPQANTPANDPGSTTVTLTTVGGGGNNGGNNGGTNFFGGVTGTS